MATEAVVPLHSRKLTTPLHQSIRHRHALQIVVCTVWDVIVYMECYISHSESEYNRYFNNHQLASVLNPITE